MTGVGLIGGGAIIKANYRVHGTATAASIWATSIIGAAVGFAQSEIANILAVVTFVTLSALGRLEARKMFAPTSVASSNWNAADAEKS